MKKKYTFFIVLFIVINLIASEVKAQKVYVETEGFNHKGGWVVDQQSMNVMGSPYLLAHGLGQPVEDATTEVSFDESGVYAVYVRTYNWTSPWKEGEGPGKFKLAVGRKTFPKVLGSQNSSWMWQYVGKTRIKSGKVKLALKDLTGFDGRCDAIYFTTDMDALPPNDIDKLEVFRRKLMHFSSQPKSAGNYDLVIVGGGVSGISAAVSAARLGCKVALINDRPILGGNNSSEIRVHLGGRIEVGPYKALGGLLKEFGHTKQGNAEPATNYEDWKKETIVVNEKNISLFSNCRAYAVAKKGDQISSVTVRNILTNEDLEFFAPLFVDCTGDGTVGYLAGADYHMGRESRAEFGEKTAPEVADKMTMGASVQWYAVDIKKSERFPRFSYGVTFNEANAEKVTKGDWNWEAGMNMDQIKEIEHIRDYGLMVVYSNWSFLKNDYSKKEKFKNKKLGWVAYVTGKRESRRLLGDYILKEDDLLKSVFHEDASFTTSWTIDLHYPEPQNSMNFPDAEFKSIAKHIKIHLYPVPYRCLYSRNVTNLFMAGRDISATHVALGTTRLMRTGGMMGEVVGMAAHICIKNKILPRKVYHNYLPELKEMMNKGVGQKGLKNNQQFNEGGTLGRYERK